jgi:hypothetical protein
MASLRFRSRLGPSNVPPGFYAATVSGKNGTSAVALLDIYDLS